MLARDRRVARRDWLLRAGIIALPFTTSAVPRSRVCCNPMRGLLASWTPSSRPKCLARHLPVVTANWRHFVAVRVSRHVIW